jgi:serine protease inhibitor
VSINRLVQALNSFTFRLLAAAASRAGTQTFLSPYSIHSILAMTANGARRETLEAMKDCLRVARHGRTSTNEMHLALRQALTENPQAAIVAIANGIWTGQATELRSEFRRRCLEYYAAQAEPVDFQAPETLKMINGWVAEATQQRIQDLIKPIDLALPPVILLVNAIYFKGLWDKPFDPQRTQPGAFYLTDGGSKPVQMMKRKGSYAYAHFEEAQIISLPYQQGTFSLDIALPQPGLPLSTWLQLVDGESWPRLLSRLESAEVELSLPRFKVETELELTEILKKLGMEVAFTSQADFADMVAGQAQISRVVHKAFLEVNEQGSEAAAATAVLMARGSLFARQPERMIVDRPFFCTIRHRPSGAILFAGAVTEPGSMD